MFKVGDRVSVTAGNQCYSSYDDFLTYSGVGFSNYEKHRGPNNGFIGKVLFIGRHLDDTSNEIAVIDNGNEKYMMSIKGLKLIENTTNHHTHHDLIIAWAKGAEIEYLVDGKWWRIDEPSWFACQEYRIKPVHPNADRITRIESEMRRLADELKELRDE